MPANKSLLDDYEELYWKIVLFISFAKDGFPAQTCFLAFLSQNIIPCVHENAMVRYRNAAASIVCWHSLPSYIIKRAVLTTYWRTSQPLTAHMHVPAIVCRSTRRNDHFDGHIVWSAGFPHHGIGANHGAQCQTHSALSHPGKP